MDIAADDPAIRPFDGCSDHDDGTASFASASAARSAPGKTALVDALCKRMRDGYQLGVITNDIFTREDMEFLVRSERAAGRSHHRRADRRLSAHGDPRGRVDELRRARRSLTARFPDLDLVFLESGGDNLAASFSPELVDASIYVIDVSGGDKIPRKGGPGVTRSDLLVINKIDLAPHVGADLDVMARDAKLMRGDRPFLFTNLKDRQGTIGRRGVDSAGTPLRESSNR